jgi:hypothetical protein
MFEGEALGAIVDLGSQHLRLDSVLVDRLVVGRQVDGLECCLDIEMLQVY